MAKLIFLLDGNVIQDYPLDKERMTIGRRASNDIHIDNLAISGQHAAITIVGEDTYIEDLNSTNGTLVNNKPIKKQLLEHGDDIGLGKYSLKYISGGIASHSAVDGFADTVMVESRKSTSEPAPEDEAVEAIVENQEQQEQQEQQESVADDVQPQEIPDDNHSAPQEAVEAEDAPEDNEVKSIPRLQILNGDNTGNVLPLDKSMVKIGQPGEYVAVVTKRQEGYFITHVAGERYPIINGKEIGAHAHVLSNHDVIEVSETKMEFILD